MPILNVYWVGDTEINVVYTTQPKSFGILEKFEGFENQWSKNKINYNNNIKEQGHRIK